MPTNKRFYNINLYTIIAVYFLILVGGIVRSTGAGMGCPDWPKCFGSYVPPASSEDLPDNYEMIYTEKRVQKNERLAKTLSAIGFSDLAKKVLSDPGVASHTSFDVTKAWIEYLNRLVGVLIGLFIIVNLYYSVTSGSSQQLWLGISGFVLVLFQGWFGSLVVSTNLLPGFITFHMFLALLLVALLLYQHHLLSDDKERFKGRGAILGLLILFFIQVLLGTGVRESVDGLSFSGVVRTEWIDQLGLNFIIHRSYSLLLLGLAVYIIYINREIVRESYLLKGLIGLFAVEILLGVILTYAGFPAFAQPAHLFVGSIAFGVIFYLFLNSSKKTSIG